MAHRFEQIQPPHCYTKQEVDNLIKDAIEEATVSYTHLTLPTKRIV